jgi:hypothetical protein
MRRASHVTGRGCGSQHFGAEPDLEDFALIEEWLSRKPFFVISKYVHAEATVRCAGMKA